MERLTKFDYENYRALKPKQDVVDKLGELEDILEKYDIESVEELEDYLAPKLFCYAKLSENLDEIKKYCQCEPIIHIDTCEPQVELITDKIKDLKQELAELKQKAIVPKFERQSHIYGFACGRIKPYVVIAYLDNTITLCEDVQSNTFEFYNNAYLVETKEEAEQKLAEIKGDVGRGVKLKDLV